tara:strand:- start:2632 stop:2865 length:234 start_codon:yes stop_codon:yes gene_type:complete
MLKKITWNDECKDGKIHGDGKLVIYKEGELIDEHENKSKKTPATDYIGELKQLAELRNLGIIIDEEFETKKKELLRL